MKKIMFFIPYGMDTPGGAERILSTIANELVKDNYCKVDIVTFNSIESFYKLNDNIDIHSLNFIKSKNYFIRKIQPLKYFLKLRKTIKKINPSVVISLSIEAVFLKLIATIGLNSIDKKISWEHNSYYQPTYKLLKVIRYISYRFLDLIIVLNKTDYNAFKSIFGEKKVVVIPNALPWMTENKNSLKNKNIIAVGRYQEVKGFDRLIKIFNIVVKKYPDWKLNIFGKDEGEKSYIQELVNSFNIGGNVNLYTETSDIQSEYLNSSIYAMTSNFECFPMVLLEAKEAGLPIVTFDCYSGPRDIVNSGYDGYLIPNGNLDVYAEKLEELMINFEKRSYFGRNSKKMAEKYRLDNIILSWKKII